MDDSVHKPTMSDKAIERPWRKAFLSALRIQGNVRRACEAASVCRQSVYDLRRDDPTFALDWDNAQEDYTDLLEEEAVRRAMGTKELVIHQGRPCGVWVLDGQIVTETTPGAKLVPLYENRYSDGLIQFELRGRRRQKYDPPKDVPVVPEPKAGEDAGEVLADIYAQHVATGGVVPGSSRAESAGAEVEPDIGTAGGSVPESGG